MQSFQKSVVSSSLCSKSARHFREKNQVLDCAGLLQRAKENGEEHKVGEVVTVADFADVEKVDVIGTSKGKGFQGRIKRWGQRRGC